LDAHLAFRAEPGPVAAALGAKEVDDGAKVGPLLDQAAAAVAWFTADGAYDQDGISTAVTKRHPEAVIIAPSAQHRRARTCGLAESVRLHAASPSQGSHRQVQAGHRDGRNRSRFGVRSTGNTGGGCRSRTDERRATEIAVHALSRMLEWGRPISVRIA